jgi:dihydroflavonol-4-reductase
MVRALITGGTGFVGSHLARELVAHGHTARVLRRESSSLRALEGVEVEHAIGDVTDPDSLRRAMQGCTWVFHVAAVADYWRADKHKMYDVNVDGTRNVFEAAEAAGVGRVVFTSSGAAVGFKQDGSAADESVRFNLDPARFPYGHTKFLGEVEVARAIKRGLDVVTVNPSIVMGPGDINLISGSTLIELRKGIIPAIPAGGATFIDVRDVAAAHLAAAERGRTGERYLLGAFDLAWRDLMPIAAQVVGVRSPAMVLPAFLAEPLGTLIDLLRAVNIPIPLDGNQMRLSAKNIFYDCRKAWRELGEPKIGLRQMLTDTYMWYRDNGFVS